MPLGFKHGRWILALALAVAGTASTAPASEPMASRAKAPLGVPVVDGDVSFDVFRFQCGSGKLGDEDSNLDPKEIFCMIAVGVHNQGSDPISLDPFTYSLRTPGPSHAPWREAMNELVLDDPNHLFRGEIPAGGGGLETLFFELPTGVRPVRLELHTSARSDGASLILDRCRWSQSGGSCSTKRDGGERGNAYPRDPALDLAYPHGMELDQPTCFDGREWSGVGTPIGTSGSTMFWGQGTIALKHEDLAEFKDNDGGTLLLAPTTENLEDARICG